MNFKYWIEKTYDDNVMQYRRELHWIVSTAKSYADKNIFEQRHVDIAITLLNQVPVPILGKYPGIATEADKEYFSMMIKPDYKNILDYEIRKVEGLLA